MTTKAKALDRLIDAIAGEDVPMTSQTVAGRLEQLAEGIEDGTISIGGGGGGERAVKINKSKIVILSASGTNYETPKCNSTQLNVSNIDLSALTDDDVIKGWYMRDRSANPSGNMRFLSFGDAHLKNGGGQEAAYLVGCTKAEIMANDSISAWFSYCATSSSTSLDVDFYVLV